MNNVAEKSSDSKEKVNKPSVLEVCNPNFNFGCDGFILQQNGDVYVGNFCAHKSGIVWREGPGIYITKDDHSYEGIWENDQLLSSEETVIKYPSGVEFRGALKNGKYFGPGKYMIKEKLEISGNFKDNMPVGELVLTDMDNHLWKGTVNNEEDTVLLLPENHFFSVLSYND